MCLLLSCDILCIFVMLYVILYCFMPFCDEYCDMLYFYTALRICVITNSVVSCWYDSCLLYCFMSFCDVYHYNVSCLCCYTMLCCAVLYWFTPLSFLTFCDALIHYLFMVCFVMFCFVSYWVVISCGVS